MSEINHDHFKVYKPFGILSQLRSNNPREIRKKRFLSELYDFPLGTMPIGRLDDKSEGLLLLTTDGKLCDTINRSGVKKEYYAQLDGDIGESAVRALQLGVTIGFAGKKYNTRPCIFRKLEKAPTLPSLDVNLRAGHHRPYSWISITITEGKFRQVRKMTAAIGFPTLRLVRMRVGHIHLGDIGAGVVEPVSDLSF